MGYEEDKLGKTSRLMHPQPATDKGAVKSMRRFLIEAGIIP